LACRGVRPERLRDIFSGTLSELRNDPPLLAGFIGVFAAFSGKIG
jgi:hypothetical protein